MLEYCIREDLKLKTSAYDGSARSGEAGHRQLSGRTRWKYLDVDNNLENEELGMQ